MKTYLSLLAFILFLVQPSFSQNTLDLAGLSATTPAAVAFSLRKLSTAYTGYSIKVRRSSDNAEANVAFDGSGGLSAASLVTFTAGVNVGVVMGAAQAGTISTDVSKTGTVTIRANKTGTINTNNGSLTVTGTGTSFTTELVAGDRLYNAANNVFLGVVASITNNTTLLLNNYATVTIGAAVSFKTTNAVVTGTGTNFTGQLAAGDRLFNTANTYLGTVAAITSATALTLNAVDAVTATAIAYKGTSATVTGTGTSFTGLAAGDLLISNNITLGIIASVTNATSLTLTTKAGAPVTALAYKATAGTIAFSSYYAGSSVYITAWYDQSGYARDATQLKTGNQARIVSGGALYVVNARTSIEFSNALASYVQTSTVASYLNNTLYTLNKVTAEATIIPNLQLPISTTGGNGPGNTISHYGYRNSSQFTVAQYGNDQNFNATPSTSLELHTSVKISMASSQFYKNGISLGVLSSGVPSHLSNVGVLNVGYYTPTNSYYNGSVSELIVFQSALNSANIDSLNSNQLAYYNIATTYWTGAISTDWTNTGNWSTGIVPTISSPAIVMIPAGKPFYPIISGTSPANSISLEAGTSLTVTGTLQIAGTINSLGTCTATAGTIQYAGTAPQAINANTFATNTVKNIVINNSAGVLLNTNLTVATNLNFTSGKLSLLTAALTIGGTVTNTVAGGLTGGANSVLIVNGAVSPTLSFDQTTPGTTNLLRSLTINSNTQIVTLANNLVLNSNGNLTFTAGKLAVGSTTCSIRGAVVNTVTGGLRGSTTSNIIVDGTVSPTLSFDQTTAGITNALSSLTINCSGQTASLSNSLFVSTLNVTAGMLADAGNQINSTGTINIGAGTFKLGSAGTATVWPSFTTNIIAVGGTVEYAAGVAQIVSGVPVYDNLTISATAGTTAANNVTVNGLLKLTAANPTTIVGSFSMSTYTLNMGALATTTGQGDITGIVKRTTVLPNVNYTMGNEFTSITFPATGTLPSQMSMKITIGAAPSWQAGAIKRRYDFIQTGGTGTKAFINAHYLDGELNGNIENKLVDFSYRFTGAILTEHGKANFNTTQNWVGLANVNVAFFSSTFGNVELSLDESTLTSLTWNGSTSTSWITATNWTPNGGPSTNTNLIIPDAATTPNDPYIPAAASNGSLTIESGGIVNADPAGQLSLNNAGLVWSNSGTFNANTSTITFTNANATINGITNFNNVVISSGAALLLATNSIMRIAGVITNNGTWSTGLLHNTVEYNGNNQTVLIPNGSTQSYNSLVISGSGTTALPAASLKILGDLTINGAINNSGNTIEMNGLNAQSVSGMGPISLNNLTINCSNAAVSINQDLNIANTFTITQGKLAIGSHTLTLSGNVVNTVANGITGSVNSNLIINGAVSPTLSFDQTTPAVTNALNNLIINSSGQVPLLGSNLGINGTLTFMAGRLGINGNTLWLKGNVTNTVSGGLRGSSSSNLILNSGIFSPALSFDQTAAGSSNLLNNFSVNSAQQEVLLADPLLVAGNLDLSNGLIKTTLVNSLTLQAAAGFTGGSDSSFIEGPLVRNTNSTAILVFPVGKNDVYRPAAITPVSIAAGTYSAEYFAATIPAGSFGPGLYGIATNEYWDVQRTSGPDAYVGLIYRGNNSWDPGMPTRTDNITIVHLNGGIWNLVNGSFIPGTTGNGMVWLTSQPLSTFSSFTFGYYDFVILPVTLLDFKATRLNQFNELVWTTANESSLLKYETERSADGRNFNTVGWQPATNSSLTHAYTWLDIAPLTGTNFYRLKIIHIDGSFTYSAIVKINEPLKNSISVYPNPVTDATIMLHMYGQPKGNYQIYLYSRAAEKLMSSSMLHDGNDGVRSVALNKNLPAGVYQLEVINGEMRKVFTVLIH